MPLLQAVILLWLGSIFASAAGSIWKERQFQG